MHAARAQARISNDHVLAIFDFGISSTGLPYTIMERIVGRNMKALLAEEKTISPARARHLFAQVCQAMEAVHKKNIAHRDLKPANFLIAGAQEKITVIDFSTCREMEMEPGNMPAPIAIVGTPYYMSPEQCLGRPSDQRSDIYAVGCCMFEAIFGAKPFMGKTSDQTMSLHISQKPQLPQDQPAKLTGLTEVVLKCLEKDPDDRFQTMYQLGRALTD
jgi:serine/threonine protein kinase